MTTPSTNISLFNASNFNKPTSEENTDKITSNLRSINANQQAIIANVSSISANSASVTAEVARAQAAESTLTTNLNAEITRAQGAESTNASAITAEELRAQGAEGTLTTNVTALQTANTSNQSAIATLQSSDATNTSAIATLQSSDATNTSAIATLQSSNATNTSAIATLQSSSASNASAITAEESRAQGAESTLTTNVTALQSANTTNTSAISTNTSAISTLESMIGTWDYATYGTLATYVLTLQSGGGGGGTSYSTYNVKVVTNVLNQSVYSIASPSSTTFYNQPVLSFGAGDQFLFDIQDATYSAASAALVFGTTVDNAGTINTAVVSTVNSNILLTIDSAYNGSNLVYFDSGTANMGYVAPPSGTTYTVTVANGVYSFASGGSTVTPSFTNGTTYIFDLADATNAGQQFVLGSTLDDTSTLFSTQTIMGTPGQTGAYVSYTIPNFNAVAYFDYTTTGMGATISQADYEYIVKTVTNVTGDVVYAFDTNGDGTFYNQPDLTFAVGSTYLFQTSQIASGYTLSFGTTVDGTPDTSVVTSGTNQLLVDLTAQTGDHYTYFDSTNAGMGYVRATNLLSDWTQSGSDIDGDSAGDKLMCSTLSSDGLTVAYGSSTNDYIRVKRYINGSWTSLGNKITGTKEFGKMYVSLSSDGNTVATGSSAFSVSEAGMYAAVYRYNASTNVWDQLGSNITGTGTFFGFSVKLTPDGNTIAVGSYNSCVEVFEYNSSTSSWVQKGSDLLPPSTDHGDFGYIVDITPDGNKVVVNGGQYASVWTYSNNAWSHNSTIDTNVTYGTTGLAMSDDGNTVVCGANGDSSAKIFSFANNTWSQLGSTITSTSSTQFGVRCRISSDGSIIAIGANSSDINGTDTGHVVVYEYINSTWTQLGSDIVGEASGDNSAYLGLSDDGLTVSIAGFGNDDGGSNSGHVRVFTIKKEIELELEVSYAVTVSGDPAVFYIDDISNPQLTFTAGETYVFDQSDSSNTGHPLVIGTTADNSGSLVSYQTVVGTPGRPGAYTSFTATSETVYYFCYNHTGMGA